MKSRRDSIAPALKVSPFSLSPFATPFASFIISASPEERGRRRYLELKAKGEPVDLERTIAEVIARDAQDTGRDHAPLRQAEDAIAIDSTALTIDQVVERMAGVVRERQRSAGPAAA